ncbi:hypothetical protein [Micromonospora echinofusca]|uniref:Uncharacterized protein n=1 Tax=Micromonospora echinofusca TaxID=47858 RepID=A0ABS3W0N2_MICEH|nr:hypothetical protein [Micromonospora echinofusca]MBO4210339.1 hypothetical protein [Micromonospora echinofusca]
MSRLRPGDEKFHYCDGSHRWIPPDPDYPQEVWDELVRQHKELHLRTRDGRPQPERNDPRMVT